MQAFTRTPRTSRTRKMGLAGAGAALAVASTSEAGMILSPTSVVSNSMGDAGGGFDVGNVIDQSGLSNNFISGTTDYSTYLLSEPTHQAKATNTRWASSYGNTTGSILFDLGDQYSIERLAIWQSSFPVRHINSITLETSIDVAFSSPFTAGSFMVPQGIQASTQPVNDFDLTDSTGRYVRLTINSNHGSATNTSFGELAFDVSEASAVPEPTAALLLLLAAGLALAVKRLRVNKPV